MSEAEDKVQAGLRAWERIQTGAHWKDWLAVGEALAIGRQDTMRLAYTNQSKGKAYNKAFAVWLDRNGFRKINEVTRSHLFWCMDNLAEITRWRETLGAKRHLLNHPSTVKRNFEKSTRVPDPNRPKSSPMAQLHDRNVALQEENEAMRRQLEAGDGGNQITVKDSPKAVARVVASGCKYPRIRKIIEALEEIALTLPDAPKRRVSPRAGPPEKVVDAAGNAAPIDQTRRRDQNLEPPGQGEGHDPSNSAMQRHFS